MTTEALLALPRRHSAGERSGIVSICSAHPLVIEAAFRHGLETDGPVLIEATCNQVNQDGGYTGMTPMDFRHFVEAISAKVGFPPERLILGGDHLGPNPWKHLPAEQAMGKARVMIAGFARAGFTKLHLDTSMGCLGEPVALADDLTAERAADLAAAAEEALGAEGEKPVYIIGTEVPIPGGAFEALDHLEVTRPEAARHTFAVHEKAFTARGLGNVLTRVVGIVVQPGVEFSNDDVVLYDRSKSEALVATLADMPHVVFEAHSTDYQPVTALADLVSDGFSILKVGPALTFALREAYYGLDQIAVQLGLLEPSQTVAASMEELMLRKPGHWSKYYPGTPHEQRIQRHWSFSDRIRYYWPEPEAQAAVDRLLTALGEQELPVPLISQYLGALPAASFAYVGPRTARDLLLQAAAAPIRLYAGAVAGR